MNNRAIFTKYLGWTHTRPSRIKVITSGSSKTYSKNKLEDKCNFSPAQINSMSVMNLDEKIHFQAVKEFLGDMGWMGELVGPAPTKDGYVFVLRY